MFHGVYHFLWVLNLRQQRNVIEAGVECYEFNRPSGIPVNRRGAVCDFSLGVESAETCCEQIVAD